jgi:hypothetical protein
MNKDAIVFSSNNHSIFLTTTYEIAELTRQSHSDLLITSCGLVCGEMIPGRYYKLNANYVIGFSGLISEGPKNILHDTVVFKCSLITLIVSYFDLKIQTCFSLTPGLQTLIDTERAELTKLKNTILTKLIRELSTRDYLDKSDYDLIHTKYTRLILGA